MVQERIGVRALRSRVEPLLMPCVLSQTADDAPADEAATTRKSNNERHQAQRRREYLRTILGERADVEEIQRRDARRRIRGES
jgi:hypothetical protein